MRVRSLILAILISLLSCPPAFSGIQTYTHEVRQPFGGSQSPDDARTAAIAKAKREVLEMAGTYLESLTVVKDFAVEKDEIHSLAAGVLKARVVSQKNYATEEGFGVVIVARVEVDQGIMEERVRKYLSDREAMDGLAAARAREKELLERVALLEAENRELAGRVGREKEKNELKHQFREATRSLGSVELAFQSIDLRKEGDLEGALRAINQAIALSPDTAIHYESRAIIYRDMGRFEEALREINRAIGMEPGRAGFYNIRGRIYEKQGDYSKAISQFSQAIERDPDSALYYDNRGLMYQHLGHLDEAINNFDRAIALSPKNARFYFNRGLAHAYAGRYAEAAADYDRTIQMDPRYIKAYNSRGIARMRNGDPDGALADFTRGLELDPDNVKMRYNRLQILQQKGNCREVVKEYRAIIRAAPESFMPLNGLAWVLATSPDPGCRSGKEALRLAEEALKMKKDGRIMDTLAAAHAETGNFKKAVSWEQKAISLCREKGCYQGEMDDHLKSYQDRKPWRE